MHAHCVRDTIAREFMIYGRATVLRAAQKRCQGCPAPAAPTPQVFVLSCILVKRSSL